MSSEILSLRIGKVETYGLKDSNNKMELEYSTAYFKKSVDFPLKLTKLGLEGDEIGNKIFHGGVDKAILVYSSDNYALWRKELKDHKCKSITKFGAFAENIVVNGLTEEDVQIGDTFTIGEEVVVQCSQPRSPCWKISRGHNNLDMAVLVEKTGRTGWYCRVLKEGEIKVGDKLKRLERAYKDKFSVRSVGHLMLDGTIPRKKCEEIINECKLLPSFIIDDIKKILETGKYDPTKRLFGNLK